jgi:hypothetical protein
MQFQILTETRYLQNVERLLMAPDDLIVCSARLAGSDVEQRGVQAHQDLFREYLGTLQPVARQVADWWLGAIAQRQQALGNAEEARKELIATFPAGPAQDPRLIRVVREYWLACDQINQGIARADWVDPPRLLLAWAAERADSVSREVLASMPYWPLGMTESGEWM